MSQLRQVCAPQNPHSWRIPLLLNRGAKPNYSYNQYFIPSWPANPTVQPHPQEWWHYLRPNVRQMGEQHNVVPVGEINKPDRQFVNRTMQMATPMNVTPFYYPYPFVPVMTQVYPMGFHTDAANYTELKVDRATETPNANFQNIDYHAQTLNYLRRWETITSEQSVDGGQEFTIMSYNVLAQQLLETNPYLYTHCNQEILSWEYRKQRLMTELQNSNADILCLQEIQEDYYHEFFFPNMRQSGYDGIYKKRTGDKYDGCAIFYKESAFSLDKWQAVEFRKPDVTLLDRDNVAIVALFKPKNHSSEDQRVCVATTHLLFNPKRGDIKLAQLQLMFAEVNKMAQLKSGEDGRKLFPVIICGDMNSEPHCQIYKFLHTGKIHYEGLPIATMSGQTRGNYFTPRKLSYELLPPSLGVTDYCRYANDQSDRTDDDGYDPNLVLTDKEKCTYSSGFMSHPLNLVSVYDHISRRRPGHREVTTQHTRASCTVDYIFYSIKNKNCNFSYGTIDRHTVKEESLKLLATYSLLCDDEIRSLGGLPNCTSPSDHIPLMAKFVLTS